MQLLKNCFNNESSGYMSPEYALGGLFSTKFDVFSFGVLLLEILSSKKITDFIIVTHSIFLDM